MIIGDKFTDDCFVGTIGERKGLHKLSGTAKVENAPARLLVSAYNRYNMQWIASCLSDPVDGKWAISCIPEQGDRACMVIAQEWGVDGTHNAQIFDYVSQYDPNPPAVEDATSEGAA